MKRWLAVFGVLVVLSGCASNAVLIGPRPPAQAAAGETAKGSACGMLIWGFIPAGCNSRTERAYLDALGGRGGSLTDTKLQYSWYAIPAVGFWLCTSVEGRIVR